MAASKGDAHPFVIRGARFRLYHTFYDSDGAPIAAASPDSEISTDDEESPVAADCSNEMVQLGSSTKNYLDLTATETECRSFTLTLQSTGALTDTLQFSTVKLPVIASGTAQAGAAGTITLAADADDRDDFYNGGYIVADGQARLITDYDGSTKVATVEDNWGTTPDSSTAYEISTPVTCQLADPKISRLKVADYQLELTVTSAVSATSFQATVVGVNTGTTYTSSNMVDGTPVRARVLSVQGGSGTKFGDQCLLNAMSYVGASEGWDFTVSDKLPLAGTPAVGDKLIMAW